MSKDIQKNILKKENVYGGGVIIYKIYIISTKYESVEMVEVRQKVEKCNANADWNIILRMDEIENFSFIYQI